MERRRGAGTAGRRRADREESGRQIAKWSAGFEIVESRIPGTGRGADSRPTLEKDDSFSPEREANLEKSNESIVIELDMEASRRRQDGFHGRVRAHTKLPTFDSAASREVKSVKTLLRLSHHIQRAVETVTRYRGLRPRGTGDAVSTTNDGKTSWEKAHPNCVAADVPEHRGGTRLGFIEVIGEVARVFRRKRRMLFC